MATIFQIPIPAKGQTSLVFPNRCISCGAAKEDESLLAITHQGVRGNRQKKVALKYKVPHCRRCARSTQVVFLAGCLPFGAGFLLVGGATLVAVAFGASMLGLDSYGQPHNANSLVLGAAAGLFIGLIGGFIAELAARVVLLPFLGPALLRAPMLAMQLLSDQDYVAGLSGKLAADGSTLQLAFSNADIAREFRSLNAAALLDARIPANTE